MRISRLSWSVAGAALAGMLSVVGRPFRHTRIGGSQWGELGYPLRSVLPDGTDTYWAFNALATGQPGPRLPAMLF